MSAMRVVAAALLFGSLVACRSPLPNLDPVGRQFPEVRGTPLAGESIGLPSAFAGQPVVLIVGYVMKTQFDVDRWLQGLLQAGTPVQVLEVPAIDSWFAGWFAGRIDEGMRSGIPSEDWGAVVTLYGPDARRIVETTGNQNPRNSRVMLLDGSGTIRWFHDRGFSPGRMLDLDRAARKLDEAPGA